MSRYLEQIRIDGYGALRDRKIGPFASGLNVVYGPNEAGKSTIASFVGGVLFGWDEVRGPRNDYRPLQGERAGSLVFADDAGASPAVVSRDSGEEGFRDDAGMVEDLDSATYRALFSLSSEELRSLRDTSDVAARLLTASAGTGSSPAAAFVEVEQRIVSLTTGVQEGEDSIARLSSDIDEKGRQLRRTREANDLLKLQDRERDELAQSRTAAAARLSELNGEVESLKALHARIESIDEQLARHRVEVATLRDERASRGAGVSGEVGVDERLIELDTAAERTLRDRLDELSEEQAKLARGFDVAKENSASSTAAYDALLEMGEEDERARVAETRMVRTVAAVVLPIVFAVLGVFTFLHGRAINSLSFLALGVGLAVLAFLLAAGAVAILFRPNHAGEALEARRKDAQWVMLQDRKKLEASQAAKAAFDERLATFFAEEGFGGAGGSIRQARSLLDDARAIRADRVLANQRISSLDMRISQEESAISALAVERRSLLREADLSSDLTLTDLDALVFAAEEARDAHAQAFEEMNLRYGELSQLLESARNDTTFDRLKIEFCELDCRLREAKHELVTLLLAKRILEKAITTWESHSRPEVYAQASRLFSLVTDGAWQRVEMTPEGRLVAYAANGEMREVYHLSLGTTQQLYLSMRVAMLMYARSVGRAIPVLADDILVHFDESRRRGAARVLAELAGVRQVIVFTCHRETVKVLREAAPASAYFEL